MKEKELDTVQENVDPGVHAPQEPDPSVRPESGAAPPAAVAPPSRRSRQGKKGQGGEAPHAGEAPASGGGNKKKPPRVGAAVAPAPRPANPKPDAPQGAPSTRSIRAIIAQGTMTPITRSLPEVKLGPDPARVMVFTDEAEPVFLHYEGDESIAGYFHCAGLDAGCPYCRLGKRREEYLLIPVYGIANREIAVLRILAKEGPNRLLSLLSPYFNDDLIDQKGLVISRVGYRYVVQSFPVRPGADVGAAAIATFLESYGTGHVKLASTFPRFTVEELSDVPAIRNELEVLDGPQGPDGGPAAPKASLGKGKRGSKSPSHT